MKRTALSEKNCTAQHDKDDAVLEPQGVVMLAQMALMADDLARSRQCASLCASFLEASQEKKPAPAVLLNLGLAHEEGGLTEKGKMIALWLDRARLKPI